MKNITITVFILLISSVIFAQQADKIIGKYHLPNDLDVELFKKNNKYFGKIIALNGFEDGQKKDINNPEKSRRNDNLTGKIIIKNLEYDSEEKEWINGRIYAAEKGMFLGFEIKKVEQYKIKVHPTNAYF